MGYIHKIEMTARIMVATGFFFLFSITAAPPWMMLL